MGTGGAAGGPVRGRCGSVDNHLVALESVCSVCRSVPFPTGAILVTMGTCVAERLSVGVGRFVFLQVSLAVTYTRTLIT